MKAPLSLSKQSSKWHWLLANCLFLFALLIAPLGKAWGQGLESYIFSTGTGGTSYSPTWTTMIASGKDDNASSLQDIGFTFTYDGVEYTQFSANSNGNVRLGSTVISSSGYSTPFGSSYYSTNEPKIIGIGRDLSTGSAGYVKTGLYGSSGSYIRVIEFKLNTGSSTSGTTYIQFQVQLFQANNEIRIVYSSAYSNAPSSYQVGIGNASSNKFWHINPSSHTASYSTTYTSTTYSVFPGGGRYYQFTPPQPVCTPTLTSSTTSYYISNFSTSGGVSDINNSTTGAGHSYSDFFDSYSLLADPGSTINFTITIAGGSTHGSAIWVDWNNDNTFSSDERVWVTSGYLSSPHNGSFTVPANATLREHRMRVVSDYLGSVPSNPCSASTGEFEDYKLVVVGPVCTPTLTSSTTTYYISNFKTSGATSNINNTTSGTGHSYSDFYNSYSANVTQGATVNFTITIAGGGTHGSAIWVDWNNDRTFSSDERVYNTTGYTSSPHSGSFTVPSNAPLGAHRMRVVSDYSGSNPSNPCSASTGEFEDYKLTVTAAPTTVTINTSAGTGSCGSVNSIGTVNYGTSVTVTATPASCYSFVNWTENGTVVSSSASYTFNATSNRNLEANFSISSLTLSANPTNVSSGQSTTLSTNCARTNLYTSAPYIWDWNSSSYTTSGNAPTHIGTPVVANSIIRFTTAGSDPSIDMYNLGSFNPSIYKYIRMRYRITSGTGGSVEIFYVSTNGSNTGGATGGYMQSTSLISDGQWHIAEVNMSAHASWVANGNVKGWRLDPCTASGVTMEIDWIGLFPDAVAQNVTSTTLTPSAATTYTACSYNAGQLKAPTAQANVRIVAPAASIPYTCNFENTSENGNWTIENGSYTNKWMIGTGTYSSSSRALYISNDNSTYTYDNGSASYVYAFRTINITEAGPYVVSFKWKAYGESGCWDAMYAALVPPGTACPPSSNITSSTNSLPSGYVNVADVSQSYNTSGAFLWSYATTDWITSTMEVNITTTGTYTLVFYWKNDGGGGTNPPAAVDDISITQLPTNVTINASASPSAGGSVSGGGTKTYGSSVTLTANPASGYAFENWTEGGTVVSVNASYTFTATTNRTLVANFRQSCPIVEVGSGTGTTNGSTIPVLYNWNYSLTEQIYTPCEIGHGGDIGSLAFYNYGSTQTYTIDIYLKTTNKEAFSSSSDWETVSSSNLVFSGTVTFTGSAWTTVYLDQSFSYNGTNNLMVVINNHTGSYTSSSNFYTYSANGYQAIYAYNDGTGPYTPTSTPSGSSSYTTYKNRINFGICNQTPSSTSYTITATATTGGSVSGAGSKPMCSTATLTATPSNGCYQFANWTENGTTVSTDASYTFTVTGPRTLVANFVETPWQPSITSNPSATTCITQGTPVTLTANITGASNVTSLADYTFSTGTDASKWYTLTNTTNLITTYGDSYASSLQDIGFSFPFAGTNYTQFSVNSDGNLRLGSTVTGTSYYSTPFSSSSANYNNPKINGMGFDGYFDISTYNNHVYKQVFGTAPNRVLVVEFRESPYSSSYRANVWNWQVQLSENGDIQIVYGSTAPGSYGSSNQIGLCVSASDGWTINTSTHEPAYFTAGTSTTNASANSWPGANRYYSFTPPTVQADSYVWSHTGTPGSISGNTYSVTPTQSSNNYIVSATYEGCTKHTNQRVTVQDATPTGLTFTNVTTNRATASWNAGNASSWEYSYDGGTTWTSTTSNTVNLTGLTIGTVYLFQVRTANSSCPSEIVSGQFTTECTPRTFAWIGGSGNLNMQPFETIQSAASVSAGGGTITYSSEDPTVATIDENGNVTALHPGTTTIYADVEIDDPYCSGSIVRTVTVTACPDITLGSGTSTTSGAYLPSYYSSKNSLTEQLYSPCEIGKAGTITSLSFYNNSTSSTTRKLDIYLVHTDKTAFSSTTDWIHPTAADKVYSGTANTVFEPSGWTTIYFDQPFEYNGTQFLAVIVDNNLGSTSTSASFRTYTAEGQQAIRYTNANDINPATITASGTLYSVKNQVKFGMCNQRDASATFTIAATANPTGGGTITGTGNYDLCETVTLTANPDPCYRFVRWRENGTNLSTNRTLTFKATKDRTFEAVFEEWGVNIAANGGTSDITVERGTEVTLTAALSPAPPVTPTYTWVATTGTEGVVSGNNNQIYTVNPMEVSNTYTLTADVNGCQKSATRTVITTCPIPSGFNVTYTANGAEITWNGDADGYNVQYGTPAYTYTPNLLSESFENYTAFDVDPEGSWTFYDGDGGGTYSWNAFTIPNAFYTGAGIILNANDISDLGGTFPAHTGDQYIGMFNAVPDYTTNDWLISPEIPTTYSGRVLSFYARELTDEYGDETMRVLYSTTTNSSSAFQLLGTESVSSTEWTRYTYNLPDNAKYIAINCTSYDIFALFIDDISVTANPVEVPASVSEPEHVDGNSYTITCLEPGVTYQVQVQADCGIDQSAWSNPVNVIVGGNSLDGDVVVGNGQETDYLVPYMSNYNYSFTEQIYTAEEIGGAGNISSVSFHFTGDDEPYYPEKSIVLYMKNVSRSTFSDEYDYEPVAASNVVFSGTFTIPTTDSWVTIPLSTPFYYDGTSNLMIAMDENTDGYDYGEDDVDDYEVFYFYCTEVSNSVITFYSDEENPNPTNLGSFDDYSAVSDYRANVKLHFEGGSSSGTAVAAGGVIAGNIEEEGNNDEQGGDASNPGCEGFESGSMPAGWTYEGDAEWVVTTGDYSSSTGANTGSYNASCPHYSRGSVTYLISPAMDLSNASSASVSFAYINRDWSDDIDYLSVCYRVNGGSWIELFNTTTNHETWTNMTVNLTGLAANYQVGFKATDNYGYDVSIDDICFDIETSSANTENTEDIVLNQNITQEIECGAAYRFYDSGGASGPYSTSQSYTATFTSTGDISINFSSFETETSSYCYDWDWIEIYDGNANGTLLVRGQTGCSSSTLNLNQDYTATSGTMTVVWNSDGSTTAAGWAATITANCPPEICSSQAEPIVIESIVGVSNGHYKWYRNGVEIPASDTDSYTITPAELQSLAAGQYTYTRTAYNVCTETWELSEGEFTFILHEAPTANVTVTGNEDDIICGTEAELTVSNPDPMHIHHWYADEYCTQPINSGNSVNFPALYESDTIYRVTEIIGNACPTAPVAYPLNVVPQPVPVVAAEEVEATCGLPVTLRLSDADYDTRFGYEWSAYEDFREIITPNDPEGRSITVTQPTGEYNYYVRSYKRREAPTQLVYNFDYTEEVQVFAVPDGTSALKLEVWGAEGGLSRGNNTIKGYGGKGGYTYGTIENPTARNLYVAVGGKGSDAILGNGSIAITAHGGWNGGGGGTCDNDAASDSGREASGAGGGATHIATADGVLASFENNQKAVLLVAGGGGGASWEKAGGYGGGLTAGPGAGGGTRYNGLFGQGADAHGMGDNDGVGGGGGGWLGGNAYDCSTCGGSNGSGGTGYINTTLLTNASTIAGNLSIMEPNDEVHIGHSGNGYARITILGITPAGCESQPATVHVTVNAAEALTYTPETTVCGEYASITLGNTLNDYRYDWYVTADSQYPEQENSITYRSLQPITGEFTRVVRSYPNAEQPLEACVTNTPVTLTLRPIVDPVVSVSGYQNNENAYYCGTPVEITVTNNTGDMSNFDYVWFTDAQCTQPYNGGTSSTTLDIANIQNRDDRTVFVKACRLLGAAYSTSTPCQSGLVSQAITVAPIDPELTTYNYDNFEPKVDVCEGTSVTMTVMFGYDNSERLADAINDEVIGQKVVWYRSTLDTVEPVFVSVKNFDEDLTVTETAQGTYYYRAYAAGHATQNGTGTVATQEGSYTPSNTITPSYALAFGINTPVDLTLNTLNVYPISDDATEVSIYYTTSTTADPTSTEGWTSAGTYSVRKDGTNPATITLTNGIEMNANSYYTLFLTADKALYMEKYGATESPVRARDNTNGVILQNCRYWNIPSTCDGDPFPVCTAATEIGHSQSDRSEFIGAVNYTVRGGIYCTTEYFVEDTIIVHHPSTTPNIALVGERYYMCHGDEPFTLRATATELGDDIEYVWFKDGQQFRTTTYDTIVELVPEDEQVTRVEYSVAIVSPTCGQTNNSSTLVINVSVPPTVSEIRDTTICAPGDITGMAPQVTGGEIGETWWESSINGSDWERIADPTQILTSYNDHIIRFAAQARCVTGYSNEVKLTVDSAAYFDELAAPAPICENNNFDWEANTATAHYVNNSGRVIRTGWNLFYGNGEQVTITPETIGDFNENFNFTYQSTQGYYAYNCFIITPCGDSIVSNTVNITVWAPAVVDNLIISNEPVCAGGILPYTAPAYQIYGDTLAYGWEIGDFPGAQHFTRLSDNIDIMDADVILDYSMNNKVLRYYVVSTCGTAYSNAVTLAITDRPHLANIGGIDPVCDGSLFTLTEPAVTDDGGLNITETGWYLLAPNAEPKQVYANDEMTQEWNGAGLYYLATNGCGTTYTDTVTVTVHPAIGLVAYASLDGDTRLENGTGCFGPDYYLVATSEIGDSISFRWSNEEEGGVVRLTRPESNDYTYTVTATVDGNGCSATTEVAFTVNPILTSDTTVSVCGGELPYTFGDSIFNEGGDYELPYTTLSGCDSIVTLHLTVHNALVQHTNAHICNGETYEWSINNTAYAGASFADTVLYDTVYITANSWISSISGQACDSIIHTLRLEIRDGMYIDVPNDDFSLAIGETASAEANVRMACVSSTSKTILAYELYKDGEPVENVTQYGTLNLGTYLPRQNSTFGIDLSEGNGNIPGTTFNIYNYDYNYFYAPFFNEIDNRITATWNEAGEYELRLVVAEMTSGQDFAMTYRVNDVISIMGGAGATPTGNTFTDTAVIRFHVEGEGEPVTEDEPMATYIGAIDIDTVTFTEMVGETSSFTVNINGDAANVQTKLALDYEILRNGEVVATTADYGNVHFQTMVPRLNNWYGNDLATGTGSIPDNTFTVVYYEYDYFYNHFMESVDHRFTALWNQPGEYTVKFYLHERTDGQDIQLPYSNDRNLLIGGHGSANGPLVATAEVHFVVTSEPVNVLVEETLCESELPFVYNGHEFTSSTDAPMLIPDVNGITDTLLTVNLNILTASSAEITETVCESFLWNDEEFTASGDYTRTLEAANGCDSVVTLHLTVLGQPTVSISGYQTVCAGAEIPVSATVTYTAGADNTTVVSFTADETSRDTLNGTVTVVYRNTISLTENTDLTVSSVNVIDNLTSCSTSDTFAITVLPVDSIANLTASVCQGQPFSRNEDWNEAFVFGISGERTQNIIPNDNRVPTFLYDTIVTGQNSCGVYRAALILTVNPSFTANNPLVVEGTVCANHDYADNYGFSLTADEIAGMLATATSNIVTVQHQGESSTGCDSVTELRLTVTPSVVNPVELTVCGIYYDPQQNPITASGDYEFVFENGAANGCDSVVQLHLTVNEPSTGDTTATACESFDWYEHTGIIESGDYMHTFIGGNADGCDSVVTLHLTVNHGTFSSVSETACGSFTWEHPQQVIAVDPQQVGQQQLNITSDNVYTATGTYVYPYVNAEGCPSADTLHLTINRTYNDTVRETVNVSALPYLWNGISVTSTDTVTAHLETVEGCDSIQTLILTVEGMTGNDPFFTVNGNGDTVILTAFANQMPATSKVSINYTLTKDGQPIEDMQLDCGGELYIGTEWMNYLYGADLSEATGNIPQNTFHVSNYHYDYFYFGFLDGRANTITHSFTQPGEYKVLFELVEETGGQDFVIPYDDNSEHRIGGKNSTPLADVLASISVTFTVQEGAGQDESTTTAGPTLSLTQNGNAVSEVTDLSTPVRMTVDANSYADNDQVAIRYTVLDENDQPISMLSSVGTVTVKTLWNGNLFGGSLTEATGTYPGGLFRPMSNYRYNYFYLDYLTYTDTYSEITANWTMPGTYKVQLELVKMTNGQDFALTFGNSQRIGGKNAVDGGVTFDTKTLTYNGTSQASNPAATGITENDGNGDEGITLYPNPTRTSVFVKLASNANDGDELQLFDLYGKHIRTIAVAGDVTEIDLGTCAAGMYLVKLVRNGEVTAVAKVVKQQ